MQTCPPTLVSILVLGALLALAGRGEAEQVGSTNAGPVAAEPAPGPAGVDAPAPDRSEPRPRFLERGERILEIPIAEPVEAPEELLRTPFDPPLGFTGRSGVRPTEVQENSHFVPIEDRWRLGFPSWDRYGKGHPPVDDYPYVHGRWFDPFNQNVLKGDYPIVGQHTFLNVTASSVTLMEHRQIPTATTPFESTVGPFEADFFGDPDQFFFNHNLKLTFDLFHGDAAFKPFDWQVRIAPVFNVNYLDVDVLAVVNPDVLEGTTRGRSFVALEEWFVEAKLADLSPSYDFVSLRAGSQLFTSDFRGFIFSDTNRAVRLFGTRLSNRDQFNVIWFDQMEKDTNSLLNNLVRDRHQQTAIANYFRQDFIWPGYTVELSVHYNHDKPSFLYDRNGFLVRPDPVGVFSPHEVDVVYLGWASDGHIGRYNVNSAAYWALGHDDLNPLAGQPVDINAQFVAVEVSYDRDYIRLRTSFLWASGDEDIGDDEAEGFDAIFDNPAFAGGEFSYWQRQAVKLLGVNLVNRNSIVPNLRSSKFQGQSNFVNPGLFLFNVGLDADVTPKFRVVTNANVLYFDETSTVEQFIFQGQVDQHIGYDLSMGIEYRPLLNNNVIVVGGIAALIPGQGFEDLYNPLAGNVDALHSVFTEIILTY